MHRPEPCSSDSKPPETLWGHCWLLMLGGALVGLPLSLVRFQSLAEEPSALATTIIVAAALLPATFFTILSLALGCTWRERLAIGIVICSYSAVLLLHLLYLGGRGSVPRLRQASEVPELMQILPTLTPLMGLSELFVLVAPTLGVLVLRQMSLGLLQPPRARSPLFVVGSFGLWFFVLANTSKILETTLEQRTGLGLRQLAILEPLHVVAKLGLLGHWRTELKQASRPRIRVTQPYPGPLRDLLATTASEPAEVQGSRSSRNSPGPSQPDPEPASRIRNVLWIQIESWDPATVEGYGEEVVMPFLSSVGAQGTYFPNFWAQHSGGGTTDSELSSLTSLLPLATHAALQTFRPNSFVTLPERLRKEGFTTLAFHGNRPSYYDRNEIYPRLGFDRFHAGTALTGVKESITLEDRFTFEAAAKILADESKPFFALVITLQGHGPYASKREYIADMAAVDSAIESFWFSLEQSGVLEDTAVLLFGDHMAATLDARVDGKERVPLIVWTPSQWKFDPHAPASQLDLAPTTLDLLGLSRPTGWLGSSLQGPFTIDAAVAFNDFKVLRSRTPNLPVFTRDDRIGPALLYSLGVLDP